jgi:oligopeptide transport system permease protein
VSWLDIARVVRAQTQGLAQREFVIAAEVSGLHPLAILRRHIAPNLVGVVIVWLTLTIPTVILTEAFLSYLGLGAQSPLTSLGVMLADGAAQMRSRPLLLVCPAVVLIMLVYCCNRIGDALREQHGN